MSYDYDSNLMFHYLNSRGVTYFCMTENPYKIELAHKFLNDIEQKFLEKFSKEQIFNAIDLSLN